MAVTASVDSALIFARHFSRLLWLLLHEDSPADAQLATLRGLSNAVKPGPVRLQTSEWRLIVNGVPLPERFVGAQDLVAQLIGHSVAEIVAEQNAAPSDLIGLANLLATMPVRGDGGRNIEERLQAIGVRTVRVRVDAPREIPRAPSAPPSMGGLYGGGFMDPASVVMSRIGFSKPEDSEAVHVVEPEAEEQQELHEGDIVLEADPETMFQDFSAQTVSQQSTDKLFERLDKTASSSALTRQLDALVHVANDAIRGDRAEIIAEVMYGVLTREKACGASPVRRIYTLAFRRLANQAALTAVASLLPRDRELYDRNIAIITRADDLGVEALVDALSSAESMTDRRVYYDALLRMNSGVRTLIFMLTDDRWFVVRNVADLLGEMRVTEADAALTRLLDHPDDRVRTAAANALAKLGTASAVKALRVALRDASAEVRERAAEALGTAKKQRSASLLIKALGSETNSRVQIAMITALGQLRTSDAVQKLVEIANMDVRSTSARKTVLPMRVAAVHALGEASTPAARAAVKALLRDKSKDVRGAAAWEMMGEESGRPLKLG